MAIARAFPHGCIGAYRVLGDSIDDAVGETFDKTATVLGLSYPGGRHWPAMKC